MNPRARALVVLGVTAFSAQCKRDSATTRHDTRTTAGVPSEQARARRSGTATAYDLVATERGATLVWARPGAGLWRTELDRGGVRHGSPVAIVPAASASGEVTELGAAWVGPRLALAWAEREGSRARARAAWAGAAEPIHELGPLRLDGTARRGSVTVAARRDRAVIFARGGDTRCVEVGDHGCVEFAFHELTGDRSVKSRVPLSVPTPCGEGPPLLAVLGDRFHYGVCTESGAGPVTTMFTIQPEPAYARADALLPGCAPLGTAIHAGAPWLVADCGESRRAVRLGTGDAPAEYLDLRGLWLECREGVVRARASGLDLVLDEPRSSLEPLLPSAVAPRASRAVWTGGALLVAWSVGGSLALARRTCESDRFVETNVEFD